MTKLSATVVVLATSIVPALAADLDPCQLLTAAEIGSTLGGAPSGAKPDGPTIDKGLGAKFFSINVVEFPSAAAAAQGMTLMLKQAKDIPEGIKLTAAPGLGDQGVWGASGEGAMWVTLKGKEDSYPD